MNDFMPPVWTPHSYQSRGVDWLITHPEAALFWAPGLGKTSTVLAAIQKLWSLGYKHRVLILAPLTVMRTTWITEPKRWLQFASLRIGVAHGLNKAEVLLDPQYDIVLLNYDGIAWAAPLLKKHKPFGILVADEITKLKHTNTKRFKTLKPCLPMFMFRWGLTGTPAANGLMDLFGQMYVLDLGYRLGAYITHFRLKYFHQTPWDKFSWFITDENAARLHGKIADVAMYVDPKEFLELPELIHVEREVYLEPAQYKQYKALELAYILSIKDVIITAANAAVLTSKLRQFTSGVVYDNDRVPQVVHHAKIEGLEDLVEELAGEPLFVAYNFNTELELITKAFPDALTLRGGMSGPAVEEVLLKWNTGSYPLLVAQCDMAAHGLNLQFGGSAVCWFSQTYNLDTFIQLIARVWRQGQRNTVRCYHLVIAKTIDQQVVKVLADKTQTQNALFDALRL